MTAISIENGVVQQKCHTRRVCKVVAGPVRCANISGIIGHHILVVVDPSERYFLLLTICWHGKSTLKPLIAEALITARNIRFKNTDYYKIHKIAGKKAPDSVANRSGIPLRYRLERTVPDTWNALNGWQHWH